MGIIYSRNKKGETCAYINKIEYLEGMRERLFNDVKPYLDMCIDRFNINDRKIGFWAMIRLLFPVIESLGRVLYQEVSDSWIYGSNVLRELAIPYPLLSWSLYRNCLLHGDEIFQIVNEEKSIYAGWKMTFNGGHSKVPFLVVIDVNKLFYDLLILIDKTINESTEEEQLEFSAIHFSNEQFKKNVGLKKEYEELFNLDH